MRVILIDKVIREIKDRSFGLRYSDGLVDDFIEVESVIQIIKDNIKEMDEYKEISYAVSWYERYNDLLQKYLKLSDKYFNLKDEKDNKLVYKYEK